MSVSCEKEKLVNECTALDGFTKVDDRPCIYTAVYQYEGAIYTVFNCCLCNGYFPPTSCDGEVLCTWDEEPDCTNDFFEEAEFLYAMVEE